MYGPWGRYIGDVETKWMAPPEPRVMMLLSTFQYIDNQGRGWVAPRGEVINGASTGWFLRRLFPAYVGKYRRATVIHDVYCESRVRNSKVVHLMFYQAMRCDGVGSCQAWIMWFAVSVFGPRFPASITRCM